MKALETIKTQLLQILSQSELRKLEEGELQKIRHIIRSREGTKLINEGTGNGTTALMVLALYGCADDVVNLLRLENCDKYAIGHTNNRAFSALDYAVLSQDIKKLKHS